MTESVKTTTMPAESTQLFNSSKAKPCNEVPGSADAMTESVKTTTAPAESMQLFNSSTVKPSNEVPWSADAIVSLQQANSKLGLGLSDADIPYIAELFTSLARPPTDVELMTIAQVNSEHFASQGVSKLLAD